MNIVRQVIENYLGLARQQPAITLGRMYVQLFKSSRLMALFIFVSEQ
jgi:hypothetical protein